MDVSLTPDLEMLVNEKVNSGVYRSASEVICEGLRLLKERDDRTAQRPQDLRREIVVGLEQADRGEVAPLDIEAIKAEGRRLRGMAAELGLEYRELYALLEELDLPMA